MKTVVVPTYWGRPSGAASEKTDGIFDHPTPLDGSDTLTRTLESLASMGETDFAVIVVTAAVSPGIENAVEERVESIIAPFRNRMPVFQFAGSDLRAVDERLEALGLRKGFFNLKSYPNIRNCQLLVPAMLDADWIAAVDDDEIVPEDFLKKAGDFVGGEYGGSIVDGVAGFYYYEWGTYLVHEPEGAGSASNLFARKSVIQNESYRGFMNAEGRLVPTTITLGGNMVFSRRLYGSVPFDPMVPRGEDIDYMINSMMLGYRWMMDKELRIDHFPPPCNSPLKLQEDVSRFIYEKRKLEISRNMEGLKTVSAEQLMPYPGLFLAEGMEEAASEALEQKRKAFTGTAQFKTPEEVLRDARMAAEKAADYFDYASRWPGVISALREDGVLRERFLRKMGV